MARFISHLNAMALVLLCSFVSASEVPKSTTAVPNGSFPVVDFGKVKPGDVLTLQVDPPSDYEITSGSPSGGGASPWEGEMSSFSATITGDYRGLHSGSFSGELRYTGASQGNGGGGTPTITWAGDSTATIPDIQFTLQKVSFSGDGYHAIKPDDGGNAFEAPQWVAAEGEAAGVARPLLFERNKKVTVEAKFKLNEAPAQGRTFVVKGTGEADISWAETTATIDGTTATVTGVVSEQSLPNTIKYFEAYKIKFEYKETVATEWREAGTSENKLYVSLAAPRTGNILYTIVDYACKSSDGLVAESEVKEKVWNNFAGGSCRRVNDRDNGSSGEALHYYKDFNINNTRAPDLIKDKDGQCRSWANFLIEALKINGIIVDRGVMVARLPNVGFLVRNWAFPDGGSIVRPGAPSGVYYMDDPAVLSDQYEFRNSDVRDLAGISGQNNPNPASFFGNHQFCVWGNKIYDPSYSVSVDPGVYENQAIEAFVKVVALSDPDGNPYNIFEVVKNRPNEIEVDFHRDLREE